MTPFEFDRAALRWVRTTGHTPARDRAVSRFARIGDHGGAWLALGLGGAVVDPAGRPAWLRAVRAVAGAYVANQVVKLVVRRPRPDPEDQLSRMHTQLSFPSAHATTSLCGARVLHAAGAPGPAVYGLAAAFCATRLYLGVHYPSDVLAGAVLGDAIGRAVTR